MMGIPRSFKQIASILRKAAGEDESTADAWEARVHATVISCNNPRVQSGDGLVWLNS
jgi:ribosomal protein S10